MKKKVYTSDEVLAELQQDPNWVAQRKKDEEYREKLRVEFSALEEPVLRDLQRIGLNVPTIGEARYFESFLPLSSTAVSTLLDWLPKVHLRLKESIVRLLAAAGEPFDGRLLARIFDETLLHDSETADANTTIALNDLRWAIGNTIACSRPFGITEWVLRKINDPLLGKSKEMLIVALKDLVPREGAIAICRDFFDEFPPQCATVLGEMGDISESRFLGEKKKEFSGATLNEIRKAIKAIKARSLDQKGT